MTSARICLVDDDPYVREALALGLRDAGFDVVVAPGAAAGFDIGRREHLDAIVTDMNMPGTSGARFLAEARATWPDMPIVVITGHTEIEGRASAELAQSLGANATLLKPFRAHVLASLLHDLLKQRAGS